MALINIAREAENGYSNLGSYGTVSK